MPPPTSAAMIIHWPWLLAAVGLLWLPMLVPAMTYRQLESVAPPRPNLAAMLPLWRHWLDLLRAAGGTWILMHLAAEFNPHVSGGSRWTLTVRGGVLAVGLIIQCVRYHKVWVIMAPVFYVSGLSLVLPGWEVGAVAIFTSWSLSLAAKTAQFAFPALAVAVGAGGLVFRELGLMPFLNAALALTPLILAMMFLRPLVFVMKKGF